MLTEIGALHLYSVHMPPDGGSYIKAANRLLDGLLPILRGTPVLLGGDFNLTVGRRQADEIRQNRPSELDLLERLEQEFGLLPVWGLTHPHRPLPQTLRWARDPKPPYHCDGVFLPTALTESVDHVRVLADSPWTELSDHNPVLVDWGHYTTERYES